MDDEEASGDDRPFVDDAGIVIAPVDEGGSKTGRVTLVLLIDRGDVDV